MERARTAACVAIGTELLGEERLDTNSLTIARALARRGVAVVEKRVVGDDEKQIADTVRDLLGRVDVIVLTGGLGPTADDVTRAALAAVVDRRLEHDPEVEGWVRDRYAALGREMPDIALVMAQVVPGSVVLPNERGSAPGVLLETCGRLLVALPGVPWEMEAMLERDLLPALGPDDPQDRATTRTVILGGVFESDIEGRIGHLYEQYGRESFTILASCGVVRLLLRAGGDQLEAQDRLDAMTAAICAALGEDVAGVGVGSLEEAVLDRLREAGATLATAESCTGGLVSARLTDVAGASDVFLGGAVTYSNQAKEEIVGVDRALLEGHGAVSEPVARAMAAGARRRFGAVWGIGITGIAGPGGGTEEKPVGLVHWAVAGPSGVSHQWRVFPGDRSVVRRWSVNMALDLVRRRALADRR